MSALTTISLIILGDVIGFIACIGIMLCRKIEGSCLRIIADILIAAAACAVALAFPNYFWIVCISTVVSMFGSLFAASMCAVC